MAALLPSLQHTVDLRNGAQVLISVVTLLSTSDTITVPKLANTTASASSAQLRNAGEAAVTVTDDGANTVTLVGTAGNQCTVASIHRFVNHGDED